MTARGTPRGRPSGPVQPPSLPGDHDGDLLGHPHGEVRLPDRPVRVVTGSRGAIRPLLPGRSQTSSHPRLSVPAARVSGGLRCRGNWIQLVKFGVVGASGYGVNLVVYALLLKHAGLQYVAAATGSFLLAASWNYLWNRTWTFRAERGNFRIQGIRFFIVSAAVYGANIGVLAAFVSAGLGRIVAQAIAIIFVTPLNFLGNKLWSFRR